MSEIDSASNLVRRLASDSSWWSTTAIWLAGFVAAFTLLTFVASLLAARRSGALVTAKDTWLSLVLKEKDEQIATSQAAGEAAKRDAAQANLEAARANESAATANEQAERAREGAAKANEGLAVANAEIENRKTENLQLRINLEREQIRRAQLVESILWRNGSIRLGDWWKERQDENIKREREFNPGAIVIPPPRPTIRVAIVSTREREPRWVAYDLGMSLGFDFEIVEFSQTDAQLQPGIVIERQIGRIDDDNFVGAATDAIIKALGENFVDARMFPADLPKNTLRILIGPSDRLKGPMVSQTFKDGKLIQSDENPPEFPLVRKSSEASSSDGVVKDVE